MREFLKALADWLETYQAVAIWLEGIALAAILALDWRERIDQRKERRKQHDEIATQLAASTKQVEAAIKSADAAATSANAAQESVRLMHRQLQEQQGLGNSFLQTAVGSAISAIQFWKDQDLPNSPTCVACPRPTTWCRRTSRPRSTTQGESTRPPP
jgi:hypothetical protein